MRYILLIAGCLAACQQAPKADKATITEARSVQEGQGTVYLVNPEQSMVQWIGTKPTGKHIGRFQLQDGTLYVKDSTVTGGTFTINIKSLVNIDLAEDTAMKHKLERELKSPLFFDAEKYPAATFAITGINNYRPDGKEVLLKDASHTIQGNLTIKEITKNVTFPAKIVLLKDRLIANANFNIDRTLWGMTYRADKSLQDKLINSMVNIQFSITAQRQ